MTTTATLTCARHPQRETLLRCNKCEQPFCVECLVPTSVGYRCYACAGIKRASAPVTFARALAGAAVVATGASAVGALLSRFGGLLVAVLVAVVAGAAIGQILGPLANRRTRPRLLVGATLALLLGGALGRVLVVVVAVATAASRSGVVGIPNGALVLQALVLTPIDLGFWLFVLIAGFVAYRRLV